MINEIKDYNDYYNITFCSYAYELDGVLKDQAEYYLGNKDQITGDISTAGGVLVDKLTLETNFTLTAAGTWNLYGQVKKSDSRNKSFTFGPS